MSAAAETTTVWDNSFARELPELALRWQAEAAPDARLLVLNEALAGELGLDPDWLSGPDGVNLLLGAAVPDGATPAAQAYAGHQFGGFVPRLGDGRAMLLGEIVDAAGHRFDVHLKGSGPTPFARGGDGRAVLGPMLREYVISEAMHALGVPTTRSLAVLTTGRRVPRETLQDGAVLVRVASSHLRVGSFQYAALYDRASGDTGLVRRLADYAIARHHPHAAEAEHPYLALFDAVISAQATLMARWMLIGFIHGVMNTDNMTISGETIDYGPCAFLDAYDPATVFSSIDHFDRYAYGKQPAVAAWNLARFGETLLPLLAEDEQQAVALATESLGGFQRRYTAAWTAGMRAKLGLGAAVPDADVAALADDLLTLLHQNTVDYTASFRALAGVARGEAGPDWLTAADWLGRWRALDPDPGAMDRVNPIYIPRNHLVEEALAAATDGDLDPVRRLLDAVRAPFAERPGWARYAAPAPPGSGPYRTFCGT